MSDQNKDYATGRAEFDGIALDYVAMGDPSAPPVILLHGFPEFWYSWRYQLPALAEAGFYAIAPDQRGYNRSSKEGPYNVERLAEDVARFQDVLGITRAVIVGHDWGGVVAWYFAATYPERTVRLVTMNGPHPLAYLDACRANWRQLLRSWYFFFFQLPLLPEFVLGAHRCAALQNLLRKLVPADYLSNADLEQYVSAWSQPGSLQATVGWYRALPQTLLRRKRLEGKKITAPTSVIWGLKDHALVPECNDSLGRYVDQVEVCTLPEASHHVQQFDPETVNRLLIEFLKDD